MEWKHPGSPTKKKFKTQSSAGKVMLTVFWDSKGPIREDYLEKGCTINSTSYSDLLANNLKPAIRTKRRGGNTQACGPLTKCIEKEGDYVEK
jgi:hypothetical protein